METDPPLRRDMLVAWLLLWPKTLKTVTGYRSDYDIIGFENLHSTVNPPTDSSVTVVPPLVHSHSPLVQSALTGNNDPPSATTSAVLSDSSSPRHSSVFPWMMSEDSPPLSQCPGVSGGGEETADVSRASLARRVCRKLSKTKHNANKLVHWLRHVQNV